MKDFLQVFGCIVLGGLVAIAIAAGIVWTSEHVLGICVFGNCGIVIH